MCPISSKLGSNSSSQALGRTPNIGEAFRNFEDKESLIKELIKSADQVDIVTIFKSYNIPIDRYNRKICCPFHNNGRERNPSFNYFPDNNAFHCFACKVHGGPAYLVSLLDKISIFEAANKILASSKDDDFKNIRTINFEELANAQELFVGFSATIRTFIQDHKNDPDALKLAETISLTFDKFYERRKKLKETPSYEGWSKVIAALTEKLNKK